MWIIPRWFHNIKMSKPFLILLCISWAGCLSACPLLCLFQPRSCCWLPLFVFCSIPASSQPRAPNLSHLLQLPLGCCVILLLPASQAHSLASPSALAYPCILTLRLCPNLVETFCVAQPPPFAAPRLCGLQLHPAWARPHGSAWVISQPRMLTLSPLLTSPAQSHHLK